MKNVYIGTSGYNYKDWKGLFYPEKLAQKNWLQYYSQQFSTVEINASFYGNMSFETYKKWSSEVPDNFLFSIKGPRFVTHLKKLNDIDSSLSKFFTATEGLGKKLRCVLWQFPASYTLIKHRSEKLEKFEHFLELLPKDIRQVAELRDESWFSADFFELLKKYNTALVINQAKVFPYFEALPADFTYIRFHGPEGLYTSKYADEDMEYWAGKISKYRKTHDVYVYFNNDYYANAITNATTLKKFLNLT